MMTLKELKKKAKKTGGKVIKRSDGNYRLHYKTIIDTSLWTLPEEILEIAKSIDDNTKEVVIHGIIRKRKDIPKGISKHISFNSTKAFKRWIREMYRSMIRSGHKIKVLKEQSHLPRDSKYRKSSGVTYVSGVYCYMCNKKCLQTWTAFKKKLKPTCSKKCKDRGMYHDMQHLHDGKWWDVYSLNKGYHSIRRKDPKTGKTIRTSRHRDNWIKHYGVEPKKGYHLHHINMCKGDDDISNLMELSPRRHQQLHGTFNDICKPLMDMGIVKFNKDKGYYLAKGV
tara:strand:- start:70 stop:915 length:846 start_codon:yes stop_codon:yes gene_type:complete